MHTSVADMALMNPLEDNKRVDSSSELCTFVLVMLFVVLTITRDVE